MRNMPWIGFSRHSDRMLWMSQNESQLGIFLARAGPRKVVSNALSEVLGRLRYIRMAYH